VRPGVGGLVGDRVGELRGVVDLSSQSGARDFFFPFSLDRPEYVRAGDCVLTLLS
jgi:hypothetical protein